MHGAPRSLFSLSRDTLTGMCNTCGDIGLVTEWTQLAFDDSHEMWFKVTECLCGVESTDYELRDTVPA